MHKTSALLMTVIAFMALGTAPGCSTANATPSPKSGQAAEPFDKKAYHPPKGLEKLDGLNPEFRKKAKEVIDLLIEKKWPVRIVWGKRTKAQNDKLVKQGVASKNSRHLHCEALDIIYNKSSEAYSKDPNHPYYLDLRDAVKKVRGLRWGGNFKKRWDPTHFELAPHGSGCSR